MTLTKEAEALLANVTADWDIDQYGEYDRARRELVADLAAIEAAVRAEQAGEIAELRRAIALTTGAFEEEVERLRALAPSWVAFAHGYAHQPDWHSESDWRDCESYPCNEARAALAATPVAPVCTTPTPDPASPCGHPTCNQRAIAHVHMGAHGVYGRHPHVPTRCTCGHPIEAKP